MAFLPNCFEEISPLLFFFCLVLPPAPPTFSPSSTVALVAVCRGCTMMKHPFWSFALRSDPRLCLSSLLDRSIDPSGLSRALFGPPLSICPPPFFELTSLARDYMSRLHLFTEPRSPFHWRPFRPEGSRFFLSKALCPPFICNQTTPLSV